MSKIVGEYNLRPAVTGDTWDGATITITGTNITGWTIVMTVEQPGSDTPVKTISTAGGGITLTTPASGLFTINPFLMDLAEGEYEYKIKLTEGDGRIKTRIKGTWKIIKI